MKMLRWSGRSVIGILAFLLVAFPLLAQDQQSDQKQPEQQSVATSADANADALRKAAQNPVASLISVPIQDNFNFNIGPADRTQNVLNIQPVIPVSLTKNWNLVVRWITPIVYQ